MKMALSYEGAITVLKPMGPMVAGELEDVDRQLQGQWQRWCPRTVLNLREVGLIDSAGLEIIMKHRNEYHKRGLKLRICGLSELLQKIFDVTRLTRRVEIYADTSTAIRSFL